MDAFPGWFSILQFQVEEGFTVFCNASSNQTRDRIRAFTLETCEQQRAVGAEGSFETFVRLDTVGSGSCLYDFSGVARMGP